MQGTHGDAGPFIGKDRWPTFLDFMRCARGKLICMGRRNYVKHAISEVRHAQQWKLCKQWTPRDSRCKKKLAGLRMEPKMVLQSIEKSRKEVTIYNQACEEACLVLPCQNLFYEDLAYGGKRQALLDATQRWLGAPPAKLHSRTVKMTGSNYSRSIPSFGAVEKAVRARYGAGSAEVWLLYVTDS